MRQEIKCSILLSLRVQICLLCLVWFLYRFEVIMYVSVVLLSLRVTVAWKITNDYRQFLSSGHVFFCRQFHVLLLSMVACLLAP